MFFLVFRELVVLAIAVLIIRFIWKKIIKIGRRAPIEDALDNINDTIKLSKELPNVNVEVLTKAKKKAEEIKKNG